VSFLGVTAHFAVRGGQDTQVNLRSRLAAFRHIEGSHTGENLATAFYKIVKEAGVEHRVYLFPPFQHFLSLTTVDQMGSITADNASNNDTMMEHLERLFAEDNIPFSCHGNRVW
jgi:hypothetical protein